MSIFKLQFFHYFFFGGQMDGWSLNKIISLAPLNVFGVWTFMRGSWVEKKIVKVQQGWRKKGILYVLLLTKYLTILQTMNGYCIMSNSCLS
jgi:hypothetical protein